MLHAGFRRAYASHSEVVFDRQLSSNLGTLMDCQWKSQPLRPDLGEFKGQRPHALPSGAHDPTTTR